MTKLTQTGPSLWFFEGELTFSTVSTMLDGTPTFDPTQTTTIDLSGLTRGDCAGLSLLVNWLAAAESRGGVLQYIGLPEKFARLASVAGLDFLFGEPKESSKVGPTYHPDGVFSDSVL